MPGTRVSCAYCALPVAMSYASRSLILSDPMYRNCDGSLSLISPIPGTGIAAGRFGECPVAELAAGLGVDHFAVLRLHFGNGNFPLRRGGPFQHLARGGAAAAHRHEEVTRAARAVGVLVAVALLVAGCLHYAHLAPVGFQLVGNDHRHAGANALAHLRAVAYDAHDALVVDRDEHERAVDPAVRHAVGAELLGVGGADSGHEAGGDCEGAERGALLDEAAAADVDDYQGIFVTYSVEGRAHALTPVPPDACLMALRMRVYVPHRQMLPDIAASISASVGFGVFLRRAVADMI
jgi:hypothetical protein